MLATTNKLTCTRMVAGCLKQLRNVEVVARARLLATRPCCCHGESHSSDHASLHVGQQALPHRHCTCAQLTDVAMGEAVMWCWLLCRATTTTGTGRCGSCPCLAATTLSRCCKRHVSARTASLSATFAWSPSITLRSARPSASLYTGHHAQESLSSPMSAPSTKCS